MKILYFPLTDSNDTACEHYCFTNIDETWLIQPWVMINSGSMVSRDRQAFSCLAGRCAPWVKRHRKWGRSHHGCAPHRLTQISRDAFPGFSERKEVEQVRSRFLKSSRSPQLSFYFFYLFLRDFYFLLSFLVPGRELRSSHLPIRCHSTELHPQPQN